MSPSTARWRVRLSYGAVPAQGHVEPLIERRRAAPRAGLDAPVRAALRLGLYELLYLVRRARLRVVADAVQLVAKTHGRGCHRSVNRGPAARRSRGRESAAGRRSRRHTRARCRQALAPGGSRGCVGSSRVG